MTTAGNGAMAARLLREHSKDFFVNNDVVEVVHIPPPVTLMEIGGSAETPEMPATPRGIYVSELPGMKIVPPQRRTNIEGPRRTNIIAIPSVVLENPSGETEE